MAWADGAGTGTVLARAKSLIAASLLCLVASILAVSIGADFVRANPTPEEIVANVKSVTGSGPERVTFRQDVELRVFLFRWSFHSDVVRDADGIRMEVHGAPSFLSPDVSASLLELSEGLEGFDLKFVESRHDEGETYYIVEGTAKTAGGGGALGGTIWVNGRTWLIERATLQYSWGSMTVEQTFQTVNGYTLLREQIATVDRLGAKMRVQYGGYSID